MISIRILFLTIVFSIFEVSSYTGGNTYAQNARTFATGTVVDEQGQPIPFHIRLPSLHRAAPLQQDGAQPRLGQHQGGEEPRGPGAHHHGRHRRRRQGRRRRVRRGLCGPADLPAPGSAENSGLLLDRDLHRVDQADFFPGVHTAAE